MFAGVSLLRRAAVRLAGLVALSVLVLLAGCEGTAVTVRVGTSRTPPAAPHVVATPVATPTPNAVPTTTPGGSWVAAGDLVGAIRARD